MAKLKLTLLMLFFITNLFAQKTEQVFLEENDSTRNFYTLIYPPDLPWQGYVVILPGFGQTAEMTLDQTDLPKITARNGLLTIIPTLQDGVLSFGVDSSSQQALHRIIEDVRSKHDLAGLPYFIGGFSIGGSCAIKYAQDSTIKPAAVFGIDPPRDFERFYHSSQRDIRLSVDKEPSQENVYMVERIEKEFGGTPATALSNFHRISPYSFTDHNQRAVKKMVDLPLRIYSEPDIEWWLNERDFDFTSINVTECSAMINELRRLGSEKAELIVTANKGFRKPYDTRHPHSWSIVDNEELVAWLLQQEDQSTINAETI
jgi:dienelactone hydrolase